MRSKKFINKRLKKGEKFSTENLTTKRSGGGISPMLWKNLFRKIKTQLQKDEKIK